VQGVDDGQIHGIRPLALFRQPDTREGRGERVSVFYSYDAIAFVTRLVSENRIQSIVPFSRAINTVSQENMKEMFLSTFPGCAMCNDKSTSSPGLLARYCLLYAHFMRRGCHPKTDSGVSIGC
jgi:hypothetical protein